MRLKKEFARRLDGLVRTGNRLLVYDSLSDGLVSDADVSSFLVAFLKMQNYLNLKSICDLTKIR